MTCKSDLAWASVLAQSPNRFSISSARSLATAAN